MAHIRPSAPAVRPLREELEFYGRYEWCLDPHLAVSSVVERLRQEIELLPRLPPGWQAEDVACNVFLLSCALLHAFEESTRGPGLKVPRRLSSQPWARRAGRAVELVMAGRARSRVAPLAAWTDRLRSALHAFLCARVCRREQELEVTAMALALRVGLPEDVKGKRIGVPSPYRRLDLTPQDSIALGRRLMARHPDRKQPILLIGLRTSGSYFAPLLHALLDSEGYASVSAVTIQPEKGPGRLERRTLQVSARNGALAVILDDSPHSGDTVLRALDFALDAGFPRQRLCALLPVHPTGSDRLAALHGTVVVQLPAAEWHKQKLFDPRLIEARLQEYYAAAGFSRIRVVASPRADEANAELSRRFSGHRGSRLKRVFEVELETSPGGAERRLVLVKGVGTGWLSYHAFLLGHRLTGRVPPMLGLRDGMLYSEWVTNTARSADEAGERALRIESMAAYVAERARMAPLASAPSGRTRLHRHENGLKLLARALSRAHGVLVTHALARPTLETMLATVACPCPALIDGKMDEVEWRGGSRNLQKADYEHHGMGKGEANVVDPAYDLASAAMHLRMSTEEQREFVGRYAQLSGDVGVPERLFLIKLIAGLWAMQSAGEGLRGGVAGSKVGEDAHTRYMAGWAFLTFEAARFCGQLCTPRSPQWCSQLVFLDVDGVLDGRTFGFPCTTRAGIDALSLFHEHQHSVVLNTARSALEVRTYCEAYALAGGIAEHGTYLWDAINGRERILADPDAIRQLRILRDYLNGMPGVFLDTRHRLSIRAFTYRRTPTGLRASMLQALRSFSPGPVCPEPLPALMVEQCLRLFGLDRLAVHTTTMDTTVTINGHDKGTGLVAFRDWVAGPRAETIAVGDSAPDLSMFREASRSFAPSNIDCWREARLLGCYRAKHRHQRGLLEIAETITGARRNAAEPIIYRPAETSPDALFRALLETADRSRFSQLCGILSWPGVLETFRS